MPGGPSSIVLETGISPQQKTLRLRNPTSQNIILKLEANSSSLSLSQTVVIILSKRVACISASFALREQFLPTLLSIYVRPVYSENIAELKKWLGAVIVNEKTSRLAFQLAVVVSSDLFSAPEIVLDLPGRAAMIEARSAINQEGNDIRTAKRITNKDLNYEVRARKKERQEGYFELARGLLDTIYPPPA